MASCGPSNALQTAKNHLQRDTTLQREHAAAHPWAPPGAGAGFRTSGAHALGGSSAATQFESFNRFAPSFADAETMLGAREGRAPHGGDPFAGAQLGAPRLGHEWAAEFHQHASQQAPHQVAHPAQAAQTLQSAQAAQAAQVPPYAMAQGSYMGMAGPYTSQWAGPAYTQMPTGPTLGMSHALPQRAAPAPPGNDAAFEEVFAAFEKKIAAEQRAAQTPAQTPAPAAQQAEPAPAAAEDLSAVASQIMTTLSSADVERSEQLAQKMQSSKFVALMDKLKLSEVKASKTDFVESSGAAVDPHMLDAATTFEATSNAHNHGPSAAPTASRADTDGRAHADWPPQRREAPSQAPPQVAPFGRSSRDAQYLMGLEDPNTYFTKLRASLQADDSKWAEGLPSSFEAARELGPAPVRVSDWEERYEDW